MDSTETKQTSGYTVEDRKLDTETVNIKSGEVNYPALKDEA